MSFCGCAWIFCGSRRDRHFCNTFCHDGNFGCHLGMTFIGLDGDWTRRSPWSLRRRLMCTVRRRPRILALSNVLISTTNNNIRLRPSLNLSYSHAKRLQVSTIEVPMPLSLEIQRPAICSSLRLHPRSSHKLDSVPRRNEFITF